MGGGATLTPWSQREDRKMKVKNCQGLVLKITASLDLHQDNDDETLTVAWTDAMSLTVHVSVSLLHAVTMLPCWAL